jgi:hypothetical protein
MSEETVETPVVVREIDAEDRRVLKRFRPDTVTVAHEPKEGTRGTE